MDPADSAYFPSHECGVFAVYGHPNAAELTYYGLYALQHRGQESAGIVSAPGNSLPFEVHRGMGLVSQVFPEAEIKRLTGTRAIGHVRYSTTGSSNIKNAQPITVTCSKGQLAIAHNGNLVNAGILREELEAQGSIFQTTTDSEIIVHLMAKLGPAGGGPAAREQSIIETLGRIQGAFSLVVMGESEIIGARDAFGFRPLCIGKLDGAYVLSSETCALDLIHAEFVRDVEPGEIVVIDEQGLRSLKPYVPKPRQALCVFEFVYFARPDSTLSGHGVSQARIRMGQALARLHPVEADLVVPIPDSGNYAALGYAEESGIPYGQAFVRNHYIGRTFLQPSQLTRSFGVRVKLNLIKAAVKGKRVIVVDDSIVRGTTARARVVNLREAGAKEVHIRISCPPHRHPCHYGIDFPDPADLIANQMDAEAIKKYLGADSLGYLDTASMVRACGLPEDRFCLACFNGDYPVEVKDEADKLRLERHATTGAGPLLDEADVWQEHLI
ncbi:MAG: amidophosphoribosyltransferase [Verrucomicrobium sp.]|nr:amidophosphoribosyltransferase [Verrucomicrobium sp.]